MLSNHRIIASARGQEEGSLVPFAITAVNSIQIFPMCHGDMQTANSVERKGSVYTPAVTDMADIGSSQKDWKGRLFLCVCALFQKGT